MKPHKFKNGTAVKVIATREQLSDISIEREYHENFMGRTFTTTKSADSDNEHYKEEPFYLLNGEQGYLCCAPESFLEAVETIEDKAKEFIEDGENVECDLSDETIALSEKGYWVFTDEQLINTLIKFHNKNK